MRPGLFTGQPSFLALASYLEGIAFAMSWRGGPNEGPRLSCFGLWLSRRFLIYGSFWNWSRIVLHVAGKESAAFELLPKLYREFAERADQLDMVRMIEELRSELQSKFGRDWNSPDTRVTADLRILGE